VWIWKRTGSIGKGGVETNGRRAITANSRQGVGHAQAGAQRNLADRDSRIVKDGATTEFVQAHNAQAAVDSKGPCIPYIRRRRLRWPSGSG
jgi:hypothetical protein